METKVTSKVDSHHTNPNYPCLLIDLKDDPTFHYKVENGKLVKADLMPTDNFVLELCRLLWNLSPTFKEKLQIAVLMGNFNEQSEDHSC